MMQLVLSMKLRMLKELLIYMPLKERLKEENIRPRGKYLESKQWKTGICENNLGS